MTARTLLVCILAAALCGCTPEQKVVRYKPFLTGVAGAKFGQQPVLGSDQQPPDPAKLLNSGEGVAGAENTLFIKNPDGSKKLILQTPAHVMRQVEACINNKDDQLLLDQVISDATKEHYRTQGKDPAEYVQWLHQNWKDVAKLFGRMPEAQSSPTVILDQLPDRTWRMTVVGLAANGLRFTRLWVRLEGYDWKLLWID